jgi:predicted amidohydrolase
VRVSHWTKLLQARAIENQCYVAGVNRIGSDPYHPYTGQSVVVDPAGECILTARDQEGIFCAELDVAGLREYRKKLPFLCDIRPEFLGTTRA